MILYVKLSICIEYFQDCGISLNQSFGELKVTKAVETYVHCYWTIERAGITEAVAIVYLHDLYLRHCR